MLDTGSRPLINSIKSASPKPSKIFVATLILGLKKQRDQLKQYQKRINRDLEKEKELAKKLLKEGKKDRAKLLLRKKRFQEGLLDKTDAQLGKYKTKQVVEF